MSLKHLIEQFKQLPAATQVALIAFSLVLVVLLVTFPAASTSILSFLVALKCVLLNSKSSEV